MTKAEKAVVSAAMHLFRRRRGLFVYGPQDRNMQLVVELDRACSRLAKMRGKEEMKRLFAIR